MSVYNRKDKERRVLQSARKLMLLKGIQGCTHADIALDTGIPLGGISRLCGPKQLLADKVLNSFTNVSKFDSLLDSMDLQDLRLLRMCLERRL